MEGLPEWEGEHEQLKEIFLQSESVYVRETSKRLLNFPNSLGTYLGRLAKRYPELFIPKRTANKRLWRIIRGN